MILNKLFKIKEVKKFPYSISISKDGVTRYGRIRSEFVLISDDMIAEIGNEILVINVKKLEQDGHTVRMMYNFEEFYQTKKATEMKSNQQGSCYRSPTPGPNHPSFGPRPNRKTNLLEIKLKDTDSVPEVFYQGKKVFEDRLNSVTYEWTTDNADSTGKQTIEIKGFDIDGYQVNEHPSEDSIKHKRLHQ